MILTGSSSSVVEKENVSLDASSSTDPSIQGDGTGMPGDTAAETDSDDSDVAGIEVVDFALTLITSYVNFFSVNYDYVVAGVHVRCKNRLVLAF